MLKHAKRRKNDSIRNTHGHNTEKKRLINHCIFIMAFILHQLQEEAMLELVPLSRINSHIEPFIGDLVARQEGLYTLVLDNTFSRLGYVMFLMITFLLRCIC